MIKNKVALSVATQAACRIRGRNRDRWDSIGQSHIQSHLFWSKRLLEQVDLNDCANLNKRVIKDLFRNRWRECWKDITTYHETKYGIDDPCSIGNAMAHQDCLMLSILLQSLTGHNYLNYPHYMAGNFSEQIRRFCKEEHVEFIHLVCKCPALATECLGSIRGLQLRRNPPDLYGLVRLMKVNHIGKALERRAE